MNNLIINDNGTDRPMSNDEQSAYEANSAAIAADIEALQNEMAQALEARKAPLRRLGLTEDEINTVLGL